MIEIKNQPNVYITKKGSLKAWDNIIPLTRINDYTCTIELIYDAGEKLSFKVIRDKIARDTGKLVVSNPLTGEILHTCDGVVVEGSNNFFDQ